MPIPATPVTPSTVTDVQCVDQPAVQPRPPVYNGQLVLSRERAIVRRSGQKFRVEWVMRNPDGVPVDLVSCGIPCEGLPPCESSSQSSQSSSSPSSSSSGSSQSSQSSGCAPPGCTAIVLRFREVLNFSWCPSFRACGVDTNPCSGKVEFDVDCTAIYPGVYWMEAAIIDTRDNTPIFSNVFKMILERSLWGPNMGGGHLQSGPPTLQEIRLHLRDSSPAESLLLDNLRFDDAEIAAAIERPIMYWNEIPPPLSPHATTSNFPHRFHWMDGIAANLFWMVEEQFRANNLAYSAAGVQVNDQDKEQNYARAAERRWEAWKEFVKRKKGQLNLDACWGGIGSSYQYASYGTYTGYFGYGY